MELSTLIAQNLEDDPQKLANLGVVTESISETEINKRIVDGNYDNLRERFIGQGLVSKIAYVDIIAERNEDDFNSIREIIKGISDASEYKRYRIHVPEGEWFECDILGKKYVELIGEGIDKTVIYCDGESTKTTPADYSIQGYKNMQLNNINRGYKHIFYALDDVIISNMTLRANAIRYCMHIDTDGYENIHIENVRFIIGGPSSVGDPMGRACIGMGLRGGQSFYANNCIFELHKDVNYINAGQSGVFIHNHWEPQTSPIKNCEIVNCHFIRTKYLTLSGFDTSQVDVIKLINCTCDGVGGISTLNPSYPSDWSIILNAKGTNVERITSHSSFANESSLNPSYPKYLNNLYTNYAKKALVSGVTPGTLIQGGSVFGFESKNNFSIYNGTDVFAGIAVTPTDEDGFIYVATSGKIAMAPVTGSATKFVKINASNQLEFEATKTINTVGINLGLVSSGIYEIRLL